MLEPPKQNWSLYEARCRDAHLAWLRSLSPRESLQLFEDLHRFFRSQKPDPDERARQAESRRHEKLALWRRLHETFVEVDERRDG